MNITIIDDEPHPSGSAGELKHTDAAAAGLGRASTTDLQVSPAAQSLTAPAVKQKQKVVKAGKIIRAITKSGSKTKTLSAPSPSSQLSTKKTSSSTARKSFVGSLRKQITTNAVSDNPLTGIIQNKSVESISEEVATLLR